MEHFDVADMFGRRQRPALKVNYQIAGGISVQSYRGGQRKIRIAVSLVNHGRASAVAPFVQIAATPPFYVDRSGASSRAHGQAQFEVLPNGSGEMSFVAGVGFVLHPRVELPMAEVTAEFWDHDPVPSCTLKLAYAAMDLSLAENEIHIDANDVARAAGRPVEAKPEGETHPTA